MNFPITTEELKSFHTIDRKLYFRLVINFWRDITQSMKVIALWMWLEDVGYPNIIHQMLSLPDTIVNALADEAVNCLNCIELGEIPPHANTNIPLTLKLLKQEISLNFFLNNRISASNGIRKMLNDVCIKAFDDIAYMALTNATKPMASSAEGSSNTSCMQSDLNPSAQPWKPTDEIPPDNRTLFLTFSKGYPLSEEEVRDFFNTNYGDCIEAIYMQDVPSDVQPLFARLVFYSPSTIAFILGGKDKAKFIINRKHAWARLFVPRRN
ncbi:PREDICTED: uncharacterized protein LOC104590783 [Nelumbo nucifera]|uniref:Uncharacterized protein LOC104590783 n=2 Tax=Nelumbo nucifera TaxID=4432 RepID=A0A1U7ZHX2_NELNU|nr:PREDICTED: uncharacterized protein LOC104590783 [Nelumbo nucifera]DAD29292.1 TPA_asm: hypothetical protein HUJ06_030760 [Nelumbo nucifera]